MCCHVSARDSHYLWSAQACLRFNSPRLASGQLQVGAESLAARCPTLQICRSGSTAWRKNPTNMPTRAAKPVIANEVWRSRSFLKSLRYQVLLPNYLKFPPNPRGELIRIRRIKKRKSHVYVWVLCITRLQSGVLFHPIPGRVGGGGLGGRHSYKYKTSKLFILTFPQIFRNLDWILCLRCFIINHSASLRALRDTIL